MIINWKYDLPPYLESAPELYSDLTKSYSAGAKFAIVFSCPNITETNYGTLTEEHFKAVQNYWSNNHNNPASFSQTQATVAYVIPKDYGFGFREATDSIWGLFPPDNLSAKIWNDTTMTLFHDTAPT